MIGMMCSLVKELVGWKVIVNVVVLGFIESDMMKVLGLVIFDEVFKWILVKWVGFLEEVVSVVFFLVFLVLSYVIG